MAWESVCFLPVVVNVIECSCRAFLHRALCLGKVQCCCEFQPRRAYTGKASGEQGICAPRARGSWARQHSERLTRTTQTRICLPTETPRLVGVRHEWRRVCQREQRRNNWMAAVLAERLVRTGARNAGTKKKKKKKTSNNLLSETALWQQFATHYINLQEEGGKNK